MHNNPELTRKVANIIGKIQKLGYIFTFNMHKRCYQIVTSDHIIIKEFAENKWTDIIKFDKNLEANLEMLQEQYQGEKKSGIQKK